MSFARGFNSGFSSILDSRRIALQEKEAERLAERDKKRDALAEQETFGFYSDETGAKVSKEDAFEQLDTGEEKLRKGFKFNPGTAQFRAESVEKLKYENSPEMRALGEQALKNSIESGKNRNMAERIGLNRQLQGDLGTALYGFYSEFDAIVEDSEAWKNMSQQKKDLFFQEITSQANSIYEAYGVNPLEIFLDDNLAGYETASDIQNMISKNPDIISNLNLNDYSPGLNSLFNMQTKKHIGKKFEGDKVKGVVKEVSLDFSNYKVDPNNNTIILNANYKVETEDGTVVDVKGVLNDTNRDVINPNLVESDDVAFSLNDLIDYTSAGASMLGFMADAKYSDVFIAGKQAAEKQIVMFPKSDYGEYKKNETEAHNIFAKQAGKIDRDFRNAGVDIIYNDLFGKRSNQSNSIFISDEVTLVDTIINNFSYSSKLLEPTEDTENYPSGFKIKRDENGDLLPIHEFKTFGIRSVEDIFNDITEGRETIFDGDSSQRVNYSFKKLKIDLNNTMSQDEIAENLNKIDSTLYADIVATLEEAGRDVTVSEILRLAKQLEEDGAI